MRIFSANEVTISHTCHFFFTHLLVPSVSALLLTAGRLINMLSIKLESKDDNNCFKYKLILAKIGWFSDRDSL